MLVAIALQESGCSARRQVRGTARGFWQFEANGLAGVRRHQKTSQPFEGALNALVYSPTMHTDTLLAALEHNDVLACVCARLLLFTLPQPLPGRDDVSPAWQQYLEAWRPGKPRPGEWLENFAVAWDTWDPLLTDEDR